MKFDFFIFFKIPILFNIFYKKINTRVGFELTYIFIHI